MNFHFADKSILKLFVEDAGPAKTKLPPPVIERFFGAMTIIAAAEDERDLRAIPGFHFEKVPSECDGCYSIRLGQQFRLVFKLEKIEGQPTMQVIDIRDYH
ncbi:MAG: type II toxin-antitoxin system RelE/ParE family toxin [Fimbriimonas sp.]